jgi:hypothetical protein
MKLLIGKIEYGQGMEETLECYKETVAKKQCRPLDDLAFEQTAEESLIAQACLIVGFNLIGLLGLKIMAKKLSG